MDNIEEMAWKLGFEQRLEEIQFLAMGPWKEVNIRRYDSELQVFSKDIMQKIEMRWGELLKKNPKAFKGDMGSLKDFEVENEVLYLSLRRSRFDLFYGTREEGLDEKGRRTINLSQKPLDERFSLPVSFGAVTVTSDGYIPMGIRSPKKVTVAKSMATTLPSGFFDPETQVIYLGNPTEKDVSPSFMVLLATELKEELGIEFFSEIKILGLVQDRINSRQPLVAVTLKLPFTKEEVKERAERIRTEVEKLVFFEDKTEEIRGYPVMWSPHDIGKIILHFAMS